VLQRWGRGEREIWLGGWGGGGVSESTKREKSAVFFTSWKITCPTVGGDRYESKGRNRIPEQKGWILSGGPLVRKRGLLHNLKDSSAGCNPRGEKTLPVGKGSWCTALVGEFIGGTRN